jgi:hypothetical protein
MRRVMRPTLSILLLPTVAGCAEDQFEKPGTWKLPPTGMTSNEANLRTMLVNPNDAVAGTGEATSLGTLSERPVELLVTGRRHPLPSVNASEIGAGGQQQQPGTAGAAGGPGPQQ